MTRLVRLHNGMRSLIKSNFYNHLGLFTTKFSFLNHSQNILVLPKTVFDWPKLILCLGGEDITLTHVLKVKVHENKNAISEMIKFHRSLGKTYCAGVAKKW